MEIQMKEITVNKHTNNDKIMFIRSFKQNNIIKINDNHLIKFKKKISIISKNIKKYKFKFLNKSLTISAHILIMVIFEIYFFFDFVINIENDKFIGKIDSYFRLLKPIQVNHLEKQIISRFITNDYEGDMMENLFINYSKSIDKQKYTLEQLLIRSCKMSGMLGGIFIIILAFSLYNRKQIEWFTILNENIIMFSFLGIFEYYFFMNVILKYEPVTNEEIQYKITNGFVSYLNRSEEH